MKSNHLISKILIGILAVLAIVQSHAGKPLWKFIPLTDTTISIAHNATKSIKYKVINQSKKKHTLVMRPIIGITQVTATHGDCPHTFELTYKQSCVLNLQAKGSALPKKVVGGPVVCQHNNSLQCYQPSQANILNITVVHTNLTLTATPSTNMQVGVNYAQSNTVGGGTAPYAYSVSAGALPKSTSLSTKTGTVSGMPTVAGGFNYTIKVTDHDGATATANSGGTITVALSAAITPSSLSVDAGQPASFTANPFGGTAPYSYQWFSCADATCRISTVIAGATSSNYSPSTAIVGTYYYTAQISDANNVTARSQVAVLTVDNALSATITPSSLKVDGGQTATFTANPVGGTAPYSYQWYSCIDAAMCVALPTPISGATNSTYNPPTATAGTYFYLAKITDSAVIPETATTTPAQLMVGNMLSASISPSSLGVNVGHTALFSATPAGGTAPYSYQWYSCADVSCSSPLSILGATSSTYTPATDTLGTYYYQAKVTDSAATPVTAITPSATLTVIALSAYVSDSSNTLWQCPIDTSTGTFSAACGALIKSPPFNHIYDVKFQAFNGGTYGYISDFTNTLWQCPIDTSTGAFSAACVPLTNNPSTFLRTLGVTFQSFNGITYAYVSDFSNNLWQCKMNTLNGGFDGSCVALPIPLTSKTVSVTFQTFNGTIYAYVGDLSQRLWQCPMNTLNGGFSGSCTALINSPAFFDTNGVTFQSFNGSTYGYVSDASDTLWQCEMNTSNGVIKGNCVGLTNGFSSVASSVFQNFGAATYLYVSDFTNNVWQCPIDTSTGAFSGGCIALTNSPAFTQTQSAVFGF